MLDLNPGSLEVIVNLTRASSAPSEDSGVGIVEVLCTEQIIQKR